MNNEFRLKQGNSYVLIGELREDSGNILQLSDYDEITILILSPGIYRAVIRDSDYQIEDNKIIFKLSSNQTRSFRNFVSIEAELRKGESVIVGAYNRNIPVEHTHISKL